MDERILGLLGLFRTGAMYAGVAHKRLTSLLIASCVFIVIGFLLNIIGLEKINYVFALLYILIFAKFWLTPAKLTTVTALGAIVGSLENDEAVSETAIVFLRHYIAILGHILFYGAYIFLYLATTSFSEHPMIFFQILSTTIVMELAAINWGYGKRLYKKFITTTIPSMVIVCAIGLVPDSVFQNYIGFNPKAIFRETETAKGLGKIIEIERKRMEDANVARLVKIGEQVEAGKTLSLNDEAFLQRMKRERDERTLPALLRKLFSEGK